jgi:hypothetical protein|tara:strand:+ start:2911 stop:3033 length:123 start_codon:yes stop_codon:yes gene_type:complete
MAAALQNALKRESTFPALLALGFTHAEVSSLFARTLLCFS